MLKSQGVANTLETSGYLYDPFKTDNIFGQPQGFNLIGDEPKEPAMMFGTGVAIPSHDNPVHDRPELLTGASDRVAAVNKGQAQKLQESNLIYLAAFAAVFAVALW